MLLMSPRRVSNVLGSINQAVLYRLRELSSDASGGIAPPQVSGHRVHAGQKKSELGLWTPAHPIHRRGRGPEPSPTPIPHCFVTHAHWFPAEGRRNATRFLTGGSVAGGGAPGFKAYNETTTAIHTVRKKFESVASGPTHPAACGSGYRGHMRRPPSAHGRSPRAEALNRRRRSRVTRPHGGGGGRRTARLCAPGARKEPSPQCTDRYDICPRN